MNYQKLAAKSRFEMLLKLQIIQTPDNDFVNMVNDLLKKHGRPNS